MLVQNDITERFKIQEGAEEDMPALVSLFVNRKQSKSLEKKLKESLGRISKELPTSFQQQEVLKAMNEITRRYLAEYFHSRLSEHYPVISPEMFELERKLRVKPSYGNYFDVGIPLFVKAGLSASEWMIRTAREINDKRTYNTEIRGIVPPLTQEARARVREAKSRYHKICSECLNESEIGPYLDRELEEGNKGLELGIYWIPDVSEIKVEVRTIERDPIIVGELYGKHYLIAQWDVLGEEPYEHYINEFTENGGKKE
jgi:hypothetical protein